MTRLPRVLAITPPRGPVRADEIEEIAGAVPHGLGVTLVLRTPGDCASPHDPRLAAAAASARRLGLPVWAWGDAERVPLVASVDAIIVRGAVELPSGRGDGPATWGRSCHRGDDPNSAAAFDCFAPVFRPHTDPEGKDAVGLDALRSFCSGTRRPVYALGGITPQRVHACFEAGAFGVASIGALFGPGADPRGLGAAVQAAVRTFFG